MTSRDDFWSSYLALAENRMKPAPGFYAHLKAHYARRRSAYDHAMRPHLSKRLPASAIRFSNRVLRRVQTMAIAEVATRSRDLARAAYAFRLKRGDTGTTLLTIDVFAEITQQQDLPVGRFLRGVRRGATDGWLLEQLMAHSFLHKPQRTSLLFLHELFVGYLLCRLFRRTKSSSKRSRVAEVTFEADYLTLADRAVRALARVVGIPVARFVSLHFESDEETTKVVSASLRDLMTSSAHIYFRIETLRIKSGGFIHPAELLALIVEFYVLPTLALMERADVRLVTDPDSVFSQIFRIKAASRAQVDDPLRFRGFLARALGESARRGWG